VLNDALYAFKKNKILYIDPESPFRSQKVANGKGCIAGGTIDNIPDMNALIWLSPEGVVLWDGGSTFINISKDRINDALMTLVDNDANWTGKYQKRDQTYHIIGNYRDTDGTVLGHTHYVYSFQTKSWTTYEYTDDDGNQVYDTALGTMTDANGRETMISGYIRDINGNIIGLWQNDYDPALLAATGLEMIDEDGDGSTSLVNPRKTLIDENNNLYVYYNEMGGNASGVFKIEDKVSTSTGTTTSIITETTLEDSGFTTEETDATFYVYDTCIDTTNSYLYFIGSVVGTTGDIPVYRYGIFQTDYSGTITSIYESTPSATATDLAYSSICVDSSGDVYYSLSAAGTITKITSPGEAGQVETTYHAQSGSKQIANMVIDGDDIYISELDGSDYTVGKLTDVTGTEDYDELLSCTSTLGGVAVIDSSEFYYIDGGELRHATYSDEAWSSEYLGVENDVLTESVRWSTGSEGDYRSFMKNVSAVSVDRSGRLVVSCAETEEVR